MTVMIGIDPHKATHTAVAIDNNEVVLDEFKIRASTGQARLLCEWADRFEKRKWAVESANGLGYLVARQLVAAGETVLDVSPMLASRVRVLGSGRSQKNDPNDARAVAIAAMRSDRPALVGVDDHARVLRLLVKRHRDMAQLRSTHCVRLHVMLAELAPGGIGTTITVLKANRLLSEVSLGSEVTQCQVLVARELVADIAALDTTLAGSKKRITSAVTESGTSLCDIYGVGPICAATIIGYVGDVNRFDTKAQFASYNGTAPLEASSGARVRHRLNPRGNRTLNFAIHIAAVVQFRNQSEGRIFYDRKIGEGKTHKEAIRALKRRISDRVYNHLVADARATTSS
jgi:transposase